MPHDKVIAQLLIANWAITLPVPHDKVIAQLAISYKQQCPLFLLKISWFPLFKNEN